MNHTFFRQSQQIEGAGVKSNEFIKQNTTSHFGEPGEGAGRVPIGCSFLIKYVSVRPPLGWLVRLGDSGRGLLYVSWAATKTCIPLERKEGP